MSSKIIIGHGTEEYLPFNERNKIPTGYTLVTLAECGVQTEEDEVSSIVEAFGNLENKNIFDNPKKYSKYISNILKGQPIHIYSEGMRYPPFFVSLLADWENTNKNRTVIKSGVYEFPLNHLEWQLTNNSNFKKRIFGTASISGSFMPKFTNISNISSRVYKNSILPTPSDVQLKLDKFKGDVSKFRNSITYSIEEIFNKCGPGVYYYVICRTPKESNFAEYLETNIIGNVPEYIKESRNIIKYIPELMPKMEEASRKNIKGWRAKIALNAPEKYKKLYENTMRTRRLSNVQQSNIDKIKGGKLNRLKMTRTFIKRKNNKRLTYKINKSS